MSLALVVLSFGFAVAASVARSMGHNDAALVFAGTSVWEMLLAVYLRIGERR